MTERPATKGRDRGTALAKNQGATVSVIIPAHNEEKTLGQVISRVRAALPGTEVIVVNDGSSDGTADIARASGVTVIDHQRKKGYGASLKSGIRLSSGDLLIFIDSDGQHDPMDAREMLRLIENVDMVVGARTNAGRTSKRRWAGRVLYRRFISYLSRTHIPDANCGLRVVRRAAISPYLPLLSDAFSFSTSLTLVLLKLGYQVRFHSVLTKRRESQTRSKVRPILDTYNSFLWAIHLTALLDPMRVFVPPAFGLILVGLAYGGYMLTNVGMGFPVGALLLVVTGFLSFLLGVVCDQISALRMQLIHSASDPSQ